MQPSAAEGQPQLSVEENKRAENRITTNEIGGMSKNGRVGGKRKKGRGEGDEK